MLRAIDDAPRGSGVLAIFDFDGTVIDGYSAEVAYRDRLRRADIGLDELIRTGSAALEMALRERDVHRLMNVGIAHLAGRTEDDMRAWGTRLFRERFAAMIYPDVRRLVAAHRRAGHHVVMATSATPYQARDVAVDLGFDALACTVPEVRDGVLTGKLETPALWGPAKADAVAAYAREVGADLGQAFAYSNGAEDEPLLALVGRPVALNPDGALARTAHRRGWTKAHLAAPQRGFGIVSTARTAGAVGALLGAVGLGVTTAALTRSRRTGANLVAAFGSELALTVAGIDLRVTGAANAWSARPAVFVFNHQSSLDLAVLGAVLGRDVTAVAKQEAAHDPRFMPVGALLDVAYIDRADRGRGRDALAPAVDKLQSGVSIVIAPEGTRSPTPWPGRFKKGAFHLAMQAGVPVVPVVIDGAGERMWRNSLIAHPGRVDVTVLEPIPTDDWTLDDLDERVEGVRELFVRTLGLD
nr:HAD-IB family hydrolase [Rhodococcus sp. HNM0569]